MQRTQILVLFLQLETCEKNGLKVMTEERELKAPPAMVAFEVLP
jgi:hypothetical protein